MRDVSGSTVGLTGAAVDITDRKQGEAHLRLLLRELTHRSKNLLAVIQAMARQTAKHGGTVQAFVESSVFAEAVAACEHAQSTTPFKWNGGKQTAVVGLTSVKLNKDTVIASYTLHDFRVLDLAASDRQVVAQVVIDISTPDGGRYRDEELHLWTFGESGRITALRHYIDTAKHLAAAEGEDTTRRPAG